MGRSVNRTDQADIALRNQIEPDMPSGRLVPCKFCENRHPASVFSFLWHRRLVTKIPARDACGHYQRIVFDAQGRKQAVARAETQKVVWRWDSQLRLRTAVSGRSEW
jgi:hypothetical protein